MPHRRLSDELMLFDEAIAEVQKVGFNWENLNDYVSFDQSLREGNYQKSLTAVLEAIPAKSSQSILMDIMDARVCV